MKKELSKIKVYAITVLAWFVACAVVNLWLMASYIANPNDGDIYAHTWGYQLVVLVIFRLPGWLFGLLVILAGESALIARHCEPSGKRCNDR